MAAFPPAGPDRRGTDTDTGTGTGPDEDDERLVRRAEPPRAHLFQRPRATPVLRKVSLFCGPAGGKVHDPKQACQAIAAVNGNLTRLTPAQTACTMQYTPVTVTAAGRWRGAPIRYTHTFGNSCVLHTNTGSVFDF